MKRTLFFLITNILTVLSIQAQQTWFVDQNAPGTLQDGHSWQNAFTDLQQALSNAQYGDAIWVAQGVYMPTPDTDRYKTFRLVNGTRLYGGFSGTETQLTERIPEIHETILSGDIGQPEVKTDNCLHILTGVGLDSNSVLDGFTVTHGYSADALGEYPYNNTGAGLLLLGMPGIANACPRIVNCRFKDNSANSGGAILIDWINLDYPLQDTNYVNPVLRNCVFESNRAYQYGGAILKKGPVGQGDTLLWENCRFIDNWASGGYGGGISILQPGSSNFRLLNCLFERDSALEGGGLSYSIEDEDSITTVLYIDSCRFEHNWSLSGAGLSYFDYSSSLKTQFFFRLNNCEFKNNFTKSGDGSAFFVSSSNQSKIFASVRNCSFVQNLTGTAYSAYFNAFLGSEAEITVADCIFMGNLSWSSPLNNRFPLGIGAGGAGAPSKINTRIYNCVFANNGGGIVALGGKENWILTEVTNCTFYKNNLYPFIKSFYSTFGTYYNKMAIRNCIIWEPNSTPATLFYSNVPQDLNYHFFNIDYCLLNFSETELGTINGSANALGDHNIYATDPMFKSQDSSNFRLKLCSPSVDYGTNQPVEQLGLLADLDGLPRIRFGVVDLGAYEAQDSCISIGIEDLPVPKQLLISPNPSMGHLSFKLPDTETDGQMLTVISENGTIVYQKLIDQTKDIAFDLKWLDTGIYFVRVSGQKEMYLGKWMKL